METLLQELDKFTGTEKYFCSDFRILKLTDGIHYLREKANCHWLINVIESVQNLKKIKENKGFIVWRIEVSNDEKFKITAWSDKPYESNLLYEQRGDYTDFPLNEFEFYQIDDVLLLKSEY